MQYKIPKWSVRASENRETEQQTCQLLLHAFLLANLSKHAQDVKHVTQQVNAFICSDALCSTILYIFTQFTSYFIHCRCLNRKRETKGSFQPNRRVVKPNISSPPCSVIKTTDVHKYSPASAPELQVPWSIFVFCPMAVRVRKCNFHREVRKCVSVTHRCISTTTVGVSTSLWCQCCHGDSGAEEGLG